MVENSSITTRFTASLLFNILRGVITLTTGILLARFLGVDDYGRMAFLLASFAAFKSLIDMSSSAAFFTFLSKETRSKRFINIYLGWMAFQLLFSLVLVGLVLPDGFLANIWHNEGRLLVILALIATFMQQSAWQVASQMAEAQRKTIAMQKLNNLIVASYLLFILLFYYFDELALPLIFIVVSIEWAIGAYFAARMYQGSDDESDSLSSVFQEFWKYCKPLIPYAWLGFLYEFLDRWMLQLWGGNEEQAYYAVAKNFVFIVLLATISILRIFWKEIAEAHHQGNMDKMQRLYQKTTRILYFIGAFIAGALIPWSAEILDITVGDEYIDGKITFMIMLVYPVHQSMGQIGGAVLFATEKVKLQTIIGSVFMITSILVAYFVLAPSDAVIPGFNLASEGLAWKMVVLQFIQVNILAYVIARVFNWQYKWLYQIIVLGGAIFIGHLAKFMTFEIFTSVSASIVISSFLYFLMIIFLLYLYPAQISGITKQELNSFISKVYSKPS